MRNTNGIKHRSGKTKIMLLKTPVSAQISTPLKAMRNKNAMLDHTATITARFTCSLLCKGNLIAINCRMPKTRQINAAIPNIARKIKWINDM